MTFQFTARPRPNDVALNADLSRWIELASQGDVQAFQSLYEASAPSLLRLVRTMVGRDHAEDVLTDVYFQAWCSLSSYDKTRGEPMAWLIAMARTRALDLLRREKVRSSPSEVEVAPGVVASPEEDLLLQEQQELVRAALRAALSPRERLVIALAYFRDCTHNEIAHQTGWPLGSVKSLARRAQAKVRAYLSPVSPNLDRRTSTFCTLLPAVEKQPAPTMERRGQAHPAHASTYQLHL